MVWFSENPMALPDLYQVAHVLSEAVINAAHGAEGAVPPANVPGPVQLPVPVVPGVEQVLVNLGGWWFVLWMLLQYATRRLSGFVDDVIKRLDRIETSVQTNFQTLATAMSKLNEDLRVIIEKSCSDDNLPAVTEPPRGRRSGSKSHQPTEDG